MKQKLQNLTHLTCQCFYLRKPRSTENMLRLIHEAISRRTVDAQQMNQSSSRSHMLMKLIIKTVSNDVVQNATLYFTDLAGR